MGGSLGYEFLGININGKYSYRVLLTTYIDCSPSSQIPYAEDPLMVGVFSNNLSNPGANKQRIDSVLVHLSSSVTYFPSLPPDCPLAQNSCILEARYEGFIELSASASGYYLFYERCCRNIGIMNLQPEQSAAYISYIPPTNITNSSPIFVAPPIPFICANDPTVMFNTAVDPDGDSLVYQFSTAYNGFGDEFFTMPPLPHPVLDWPIPSVIFAPGYNQSQPFGPGGNATLDSHTGMAEYTAPVIGPFVIAVDVYEYRNGILIGSIRRDLQLIVIPCPNNASPQLVDNLQLNYEITQGDTLCFPISFQDPENDSVFIDANGDIFDPSIINNPAAFFVTDVDSNRATGNFCWIVPCSFDTGKYDFYIHSVDDGCPPKDKFEFYTIRVLPPEPPELFGSDSACKGIDSVLYWMMIDEHYQYNWNLAGGAIIQNYGDSIVVDWGADDSGYVHVNIFTASGCYISSDSMDVNLIDIPILFAMPEDTVCELDTLLLTATGTVNYYWYPESELVIPAEGDANAIIDHSGWFYVAGLPGALCPPSDSVYITALELPEVTAITDDSSLCFGDTVHLFSTGGINHHWSPEALVFDPDSANTGALTLFSGIFIVTGTDTNQCKNSDTVSVMLHQNPTITLDAIGQICIGDTAIITATGGIQYIWSPNSFMIPDTGSVVSVFPNMNTTYLLEITDSNGCKSDTSFDLSVILPPDASFTFDTLKINCDGTWIQFENTSAGANGSHWILGNGTTSDDINPQMIYPFGGTYVIQLIASSLVQCSDIYIDTISTVDLQSLAVIKPVNVFTPNGDGLNDVLDFSLPAEFVECSKLYVYDRWGVLMFESTIDSMNWDGKMGNVQVPEGVYYWIIGLNGIPFKGFVHVFN
jgi:gliding motility-associated-like protein